MSTLVQNTEEWLEIRRSKIGASDAPIIMGISPWKTPYQLWEEKLQLTAPSQKRSYMQRGLDLEEKARECFEKQTGLIVFPQVIYHPEHEWMMASLDGIDFAHKNIVEIKCPGREDHAQALNGKVPEKYFPQLQHQMEVAGVDESWYFSFDGVDGKYIKVYRDDKYVSKLVAKEQEFWGCMQNLEAPKMTERDFVEKDDELWNVAAESWRSCSYQLQVLKAKEEELRETLIALSGRSNAKGAGIRLSRVVRRGAVDYKAIPELHGVDLDKYRKSPIESWRLTSND